MRRVVYALLAVNLLLLAWNLTRQGDVDAAPDAGDAATAGQDGSAGGLIMLSELEPGALRPRGRRLPAPVPGEEAAGDPAAAAGPDSLGPEVVLRCLTVGPLPPEADADAVGDWLSERGARVDIRRNERREVPLYWIYFPPPPTRDEAVALVERLRDQGLDDVLVVRKGDMANAISLGVFSRTDTRDRRLRQLEERGYQPSIAPRYRVREATWVDAGAPAGSIEREEVRSAFPRYEVSERPCARDQIAAATGASYNPFARAPANVAGARRRFHFSGQ